MEKIRMNVDKKNTADIQRPKLIVMPFQAADGQPFDGIGLGLHFFFGNLFGVHEGLTECWFGWRVKKIFPEPMLLKAYCRGNTPFPDIQALGQQEKVRFWLEGTYQQKGEKTFLDLVLHDTQDRMSASRIHLALGLSDGLVGGRAEFFAWLERCNIPFGNIEKVMWPEQITQAGLDFLGRGLETLYLNYIQGPDSKANSADTNLIDLSWFDRSVEASAASYLAQDLRGWGLYKNGEYRLAKKAFESALKLNPNGLGALSGMMWCALGVKDREEALHYALLKADCRGEDLEKARALVNKKFETPS
jgi:tetratricopeptide (TPR) repeat protein